MNTMDPLIGPLFALASSPGQQVSPLIQLIPFALVLAIFYFVILLPMKKKQAKVQEFLEALKVGDKVQLQVAPNVRVDISKAAIVGYQGQPPVVEAPNT